MVTIPLLGAVLKVLGIVDLKTAEEAISEKWRKDLAIKNLKALELALEVVKIG